ncbi:MAG: RluA family pseudouridine synthase [Bacteroidota bacterium]
MSDEKNTHPANNTDPDLSDEWYEHYRIVVDPKQSPLRLDKFLLDRIERASRNRIQNAIKSGAVRVDNQQVKPNFKVKPGQVVSVYLPYDPAESHTVKAEPIPLDIRYEDDDIMVVYKPPGLVVHPGVGNPSGTLVNGLLHYFQDNPLPVKEGNANDRPGLVHRIDKETSGLLVIAKNDDAMTHLGKQFFNHTVKREYIALVWGEPDEKEGTIENRIGRNPKYFMKRMVIPEDEPGGKHAITHYKVLEGLYYVSLVSCRLETGRTHQIRVHFRHMGHPLFNDKRYDGDQIRKGTVYTKYRQFVENCFELMPRQALHARSLGFVHPRTGEAMHFETDLPDDFQQVLDKWRNYLQHRKDLS